jgi:hypothetical protein
LASTIDYWQQFGKELIFVTGMPDFLGYEFKLAKGLSPRPNFDVADLSEATEVLDYLRSRSVQIINRRSVFCALADDCGYEIGDGDLLLVDQEHLSRTGARLFGERLLRERAFDEVAHNLTPSSAPAVLRQMGADCAFRTTSPGGSLRRPTASGPKDPWSGSRDST